MKRGPGPQRKTPLTSSSELSRGTGLARGQGLQGSTPMPRSPPHDDGKPKPARNGKTPGTSRAAGVPARVRLAVYERDDNRCGRCGRDVWSGIRSLQHRDPRGVGGGGPNRHAMSNLVTVCGLLSTDPAFCHYWCESQRTRAQAVGFLVPSGIAPSEWAIQYHDGWFFLDDLGHRTPTGPYGASS